MSEKDDVGSEDSTPEEDPLASSEKKAITEGLLEFSIDLIKTLHQKTKETENLIFSPLSISAAISLVYLGAAGSTHEEIGKLLRSPLDNKESVEKFHENVGNILKSIFHNQDPKFSCAMVTLANGIFVQEGLGVKPSYLNQAINLHKTEVTNVDFSKNGNAAMEKINTWVSEKTNGRIPRLFESPLETDTLIVLANALYFNGVWYEKFASSNTKMEKFFIGTEEIMVPMMHHKYNVPYMNNRSLKFEAINLDYSGFEYSMSIILPYIDQSLTNLIKNLKPEYIIVGNSWGRTSVDYKFPRFKFSSSMSLKDTLSKLGMQDAFNSTKANFSSMMEVSAFLADIKHAAEIELDEDGTKASAITAPQFILCCGTVIHKPIKFYVNRSFMAVIYHQPTSTILFSSIVNKPMEKFFTGTEEIMVPMMHHKYNVPYMNNRSLKFEAINLDYSGFEYSMSIILPYIDQSLTNLIKNLKPEYIIVGNSWGRTSVDYKIPRFKFSSSMSLKDTLSKLGMQDTFNSTKANFSSMMEVSAFLADIKHAAEIELDEDGTKASAITAAQWRFLCGTIIHEPIKFYVNRPFMAMIYNRRTSTILFSAIVNKPI